MDLDAYRSGLDAWLGAHADALRPPYAGTGTLDEEVAQLAKVRSATFDAGWMRSGWPERVGGLAAPTSAAPCSARQ